MYLITDNRKSNSCKKKVYSNGKAYSTNNTMIRNNGIWHKNRIISKIRYKREECENSTTRKIKAKRNTMYGYSKTIQMVKISKKIIHDNGNKNIRKPVTTITTVKYCTNNNTHVKSKVLCTGWLGTKTGEYTWQLRRSGSGRRYVDVPVIKVCKKDAMSGAAYVHIYSKSDITEMAENNGQMDVDPEVLGMYGPYGKPKMNLRTSVITRCKTIVRCSNPMNMYIMSICTCKTPEKCSNSKTAVKKHADRNVVKVHVRNEKHSYAEIIVSRVCIYVEVVYTNTWSARSKTVEIQSSSWHKEYGE